MRQVDVEGRTVAVHVEEAASPNGIDVILIHGAGFDHTAWRFQTRFLAGRGFRVLAPDLPGHGSSEGPTLASIDEMAAWLGDLAGAFESKRSVLIGHSMGSYIALRRATLAPDTVLALVLVGTTDRMRVHPELLDAAARRDDHAIDLMVGWMHTGLHRYGGHRSAGSWSAGTSSRILERNMSALGSDLAACDAFDPTSAALTCPTLIVSGTADRMTRASAAGRLADLVDCDEHVMLEGAGHMALFERAEDLNAALVRFLAEVTVAAQ